MFIYRCAEDRVDVLALSFHGGVISQKARHVALCESRKARFVSFGTAIVSMLAVGSGYREPWLPAIRSSISGFLFMGSSYARLLMIGAIIIDESLGIFH